MFINDALLVLLPAGVFLFVIYDFHCNKNTINTKLLFYDENPTQKQSLHYYLFFAYYSLLSAVESQYKKILFVLMLLLSVISFAAPEPPEPYSTPPPVGLPIDLYLVPLFILGSLYVFYKFFKAKREHR